MGYDGHFAINPLFLRCLEDFIKVLQGIINTYEIAKFK